MKNQIFHENTDLKKIKKKIMISHFKKVDFSQKIQFS